MRQLIVSSVVAVALVALGAVAWQARAATSWSGPASLATTIQEETKQAEPARCWRGAPPDGCGWGWRRNRWGHCRPC
jgi:hypothetical protein